jgi:excisionase family DNA binding protein
MTDLAQQANRTDRDGIVVPLAYTPENAARAVGRSRTRIFKALRDKELTGRKDGRATLIERDELQRWVHSLPTIGQSAAA